MSRLSDRKKTRRMLLLLGAISLTPFLGSLLLYYFWTPQAFTNYGELVTPTALADVTIPSMHGKALRIEDLRGNWVFLMADSGHCDHYCQSKLYIMRQIRLTQGKDQFRIERVWLIPDGVQPAPDIETAFRGTITVLASNDQLLARLPAADSVRDHIYVIDPFGNLMMRFPRNADPQKMKRDIDKLMKMSGGWMQTGK
jgi:hypothetical protein